MHIEIDDLKQIHKELRFVKCKFITALKDFSRDTIDTPMFLTVMDVQNCIDDAKTGIDKLIELQEQEVEKNNVPK